MWLAFGAHPDDVELAVGGTLLCIKKYTSKKTGIIHLTYGELGTRGTKEIREREAKEAAKLLKLDYLNFLGLKDTAIQNDPEVAKNIACIIRELKPEVLLLPYGEDYHHPDHEGASHLLKRALFYSKLSKLEIPQEPWSNYLVFYYFQHTIPIPTPTFVIDVTDVIEEKLKVLQAYESQFKDSPLKKIIEVTLAKMRLWGSLIGKDYGEGIFSRIPLPITFDPSSCILNFFY